ncbi:MAG: ferritin family protein [Candidatus Omnitrophota bacterium]
MRIQEKNGNFEVVDFDAVEAYKIACKIETDGLEFYAYLLKNVAAEPARKALFYLLKEEQKHLSLFESRLSELRQRTSDLSEDDDLLSSMEYGIFQPYKNIEELALLVRDPAKALRLGLKVEDVSIGFYEACRNNVISPQAKEEISSIIKEEQKHKRLLQEILGKGPVA